MSASALVLSNSDGLRSGVDFTHDTGTTTGGFAQHPARATQAAMATAFIAAILEVLLEEKQAIVRSSILAYKEARNGESYHPGYTEHERMAWEIGRAEVEKVKRQ